MGNGKKAVKVLLKVPANDGLFTYLIPPALENTAKIGCAVEVPFNRRRMAGVIWGEDVDSGEFVLKEIIRVLDPIPVLTEAQRALAETLQQRTPTPLSFCANVFLLEKLQSNSTVRYHLTEKAAGIPLESGLLGTPSQRDQILSMIKKASRPLSLQELKQKAPELPVQRILNALIKEELVEGVSSLAEPTYKPKTVKVVRIAGNSGWQSLSGIKLGANPQVAGRREAILATLSTSPQGLPLAELKETVTFNPGDIKFLEKKGLIVVEEQQVWRDYSASSALVYPHVEDLTDEQRKAYEQIVSGMNLPGEKKPVLIRGVTGSGKTEIYLRVVALALEMGKQALILVPEIALTPQMVNRFESRFPGIVGLFHSKMSSGQRFDTWLRGRNGEYRIIIGPRSAFSVPLPDLGLIVIDECHDDSFYQQESEPFFSAVQLGAEYATLTSSQLILGSATPTIAQMFKAEKSGWTILKLDSRASGIAAPTVLLTDMRQELKAGNRSPFSAALIREIGKTLEMGLQTILYLNRRGTAGYSFCRSCGFDFRCPHCDIPLTWHQRNALLMCHFCGYQLPLPARCPSCDETELGHLGIGVEQVERTVQQLFPAARVLRMDAQTTAATGAYERILTDFDEGKADILIGTQMVAKGLDFPGVRLVGVILADVGTNFHDYRVDELTFQLLTQVTGRAGRIDIPGIAILQTYQPERYSIRAAVDGDYEAFYRKELQYRRQIGYPPFVRLGRVLAQDKDPQAARQAAQAAAAAFTSQIRARNARSVSLIGPAPCYFQKIRGQYRWHVILRAADPVSYMQALDRQKYRIEIDPPNLL